MRLPCATAIKRIDTYSSLCYNLTWRSNHRQLRPYFSVTSPLLIFADMAESADALDSGSSPGYWVEVQVLLSAVIHSNPNRSPILQSEKGSGLFFYLS